MNKFMIAAAGALASLGLHAATYYPITIDYEPTTTVSNFPVLVRIPFGSPIYTSAGTSGENLRFTDELGVNDFPHEVDTWNASGESLVWVKIHELKKGAAFRLYCSGTDKASARDVWSDYAGVWHLNEPKDSADKDYDPAAAEPTHTTKFVDSGHVVNDAKVGIGYGQSVHGSGPAFVSKVYDDRNGYKCPIQVSNRSKFTVSCWARVVDSATDWTQLFGPTSGRNGQTGWRAEFTGVSNGAGIRMCQRGGEGPELVSFNNPAFDGWTKVDAIWNESSCALYINGALIGQKDVQAQTNPTWYWTGWMAWGGYSGADGVISTDDSAGIEFDECRIYDGVKTADRIAADYQTVMSGAFLTIGGATEEAEIPEGTVAKVGDDYFLDITNAVVNAKALNLPVVLYANGLSWTFLTEDETLKVKPGSCDFKAFNGRGEGYYVEAVSDSDPGVITYTLRKQLVIAAMRNVAVFKLLYTDDLFELLPSTVKGLYDDGSLSPGDYSVTWNTDNVSKYGSYGISTVSGQVTVGGQTLPVTAYVRAALSYSDGYHNIAPEASSMVVTAPEKNGYAGITDPSEIFDTRVSSVEKTLLMITNGLDATVHNDGNWKNNLTGAAANNQSYLKNPYVDVDFTWPESNRIYRVEVICDGGDNQTVPKSVVLSSGGVPLVPDFQVTNDGRREKINYEYNLWFEFSTPVLAKDLKVSFEQPETTKSGKSSGRVVIAEILIWSDGGPIDALEPSTSSDLVYLEMDGKPVKNFSPEVTKYLVPKSREVTAALGEANVAPTILPEKDGKIIIVTLSELGMTSEEVMTVPTSNKYQVRTHGGFNLIIR